MTADRDKLENLIDRALQKANGDADAAAQVLLPTILKSGLAAVLLSAYLETRNGASQTFLESQQHRDRPDSAPQESSRPSHKFCEGLRGTDRPAAPSTRSPSSQTRVDSHRSDDRRAAPPAKLSRTAAASIARNSVYDRHLGTGLTLRKAKLWDIINEERRGSSYTRAMTLFRIRKEWPADASLPDVYSEAEVQAILTEARDAMPPVPLEARHG